MSFDLLAPHYRWMEIVLAGEKLQRCRTAFLDRVTDAENVLIVGEGNGRFLNSFLKSNPAAHVTCVDASQTMLDLTRRRIGLDRRNTDRVRMIRADAVELTPDLGEFDLIVTHFFLDCFPPQQLERIIGNLAGMARPGTQWLLADFQEPGRGWKKWRAHMILASMYWFFRLATRLPAHRLTPPDHYLLDLGFFLAERRETELGLLRSDLWRRSLHRDGEALEGRGIGLAGVGSAVVLDSQSHRCDAVGTGL